MKTALTAAFKGIVGILIFAAIVAALDWSAQRELCLVQNPSHPSCKDFKK